jgi:hypothetical protein
MNPTDSMKPAFQQANQTVNQIKDRQESAPVQAASTNRPGYDLITFNDNGEGRRVGACWMNSDTPGKRPMIEMNCDEMRFFLSDPAVKKLRTWLVPRKERAPTKIVSQ